MTQETILPTLYARKLGDWQRLLAPLTAKAADLPHLAIPRAQLAALLSQAPAIEKQPVASRSSNPRPVQGLVQVDDREDARSRPEGAQVGSLGCEPQVGVSPIPKKPRRGDGHPSPLHRS